MFGRLNDLYGLAGHHLRPRARALTRTAGVSLCLLAILVASLFLPALQPAAAPVPAGTRIPWQGQNWYLHGANIPWYNWGCDFGCGANGGLTGTRGTISPSLASLKTNGIKNVRWWVFPGDPWQIGRDGAGVPTTLNPAVYADFDAAFQLAETHDLYLHFVLFSNPAHLPPSFLTSAGNRARVASALAPLFARYANQPRLMSWEIVNEPEYAIWAGQVQKAHVQDLVRQITAAVHQNAPTYVTVGSAHVDGTLDMWMGMGLDFYSAHWYDNQQPGGYCARCRDYADIRAQYNLDKPLVIGEFYAGPDTDALQRHEDWYAKGFAGSFAWSLFSSRTSDGMRIDLAAARTFADRHSDDGPVTGATPLPTPTATSTPLPPTATPTRQPTATPVPPTATRVPPTATTVPPTATAVPPTATPPAGTPSYTTSARPSVAALAPGQSLTITASVTSSQAITALVDIEVYDAAWNKVYQRVYDNQVLAANVQRDYATTWTVPTTAASGTYTIMVGLFQPNWGPVLTFNRGAGAFTVGTGTPPTATPRATNTPVPATATPRPTNTPAPPTATPRATNTPTPPSTTLQFTTSGRVTPTSVATGQTARIVAAVRSSQNVTVLVDVEVYDAAGRKVYQRVYDNVALTAGTTRNFAVNWTVPAAQRGAHTVKIGVFRPGWGSLLHWNDRAATFSVTAP